MGEIPSDGKHPWGTGTAGDGTELHWDLANIIKHRRRLQALTRDVFNNTNGREQEALRLKILTDLPRETTKDWGLTTGRGLGVGGGQLAALGRQLDIAIRRDRSLTWRQKVADWFNGDQSKMYSWNKQKAGESEAGGAGQQRTRSQDWHRGPFTGTNIGTSPS